MSGIFKGSLGDGGMTQNPDGTWVMDIDLDAQVPAKTSTPSVLPKVGLALLLAYAAYKVTR